MLHVLHLHYKAAIFELELRKCTLCTALVLQSCAFQADFQAGAVEVYFAHKTCTTKLRFWSWSCGNILRALDLYYKVAILDLELRKCTSRTSLVLQSCDFQAGAAEVCFAHYSCTDVELELRARTLCTALVLHLNKPLGLRKRVLVTRPIWFDNASCRGSAAKAKKRNWPGTDM